jgi:hypothetical protein
MTYLLEFFVAAGEAVHKYTEHLSTGIEVRDAFKEQRVLLKKAVRGFCEEMLLNLS